MRFSGLGRSECGWLLFAVLRVLEGGVWAWVGAGVWVFCRVTNRSRTLRVFGVLEIHLSGRYTGVPREYLAGNGTGKYSVADIKTWPWIKNWERSGFSKDDMAALPHLLEWVDRIAERPAVQRGIGEAYAKKDA
jgi:glutathione S-transferase